MTLIAGRYQPLDTARPGAPQRARDLETAQTVLLRAVALTSGAEAAALARAQAAQGIFHPSLVTLFDVIPRSGSQVLLAYEYVPSQPIVQMTATGPLNLRRAAEVVAEIADAVAELHARGVVHGGIAEAVVLMTLKGKAKLDRVGDPSLEAPATPLPGHDLAALGELLSALVGRRVSRGVVGAQAVETLADRARAGKFDSAASLAAMLRRI